MSDINAFTHTLRRGNAPLLISIPHRRDLDSA